MRALILIVLLMVSTPVLAVNLYPEAAAEVSDGQTASKNASKSVTVQVALGVPTVSGDAKVATASVVKTTTVTRTVTKKPVRKTRKKQKPLLSWLMNKEGRRDIKDPFRKVVFNAESLIARGDLNLLYEMPNHDEWTTIIDAHTNLNVDTASDAGTVGVLIGPRYYLEQAYNGPFVQLVAGINHIDGQTALGSKGTVGYALPWRDTTGFEFGLSAERYFTDDSEARVRLFVGMSLGLDRRILPFL